MPLYLAVLEGDSPAEAKTLIATSDRKLILAFLKHLNTRIAEATQDEADPLNDVFNLERLRLASTKLQAVPPPPAPTPHRLPPRPAKKPSTPPKPPA